jgi:hypothetical protein
MEGSPAPQGSVNEQVGRFSIPALRGAAWALRALRSVRTQVGHSGLSASNRLPPPPQLPPGAVRGVNAVLRRRRASCLERSLVLQTWLASRGERRDLVIGVTPPDDQFQAHAWLEGEEQCHEEEFHHLIRRPAPPSRA